MKKYRYIALFLFLANLIVVFFLFARNRNMLLQQQENDIIFLLLVLASLLLTLGLFILIIIVGKEQITISNQEIEYGIDSDKKSEDQDKNIESDAEENVDINNQVAKIFPKKSLKKNPQKYVEKLLSNIARDFNIVQGLYYTREKGSDEFYILGKYAYFGEKEPANFNLGQTIPGQVAKNQQILMLKEIPENYMTVLSGLGSSSPKFLLVVPVIYENETTGVIELASFKEFNTKDQKIINAVAEELGKELNN